MNLFAAGKFHIHLDLLVVKWTEIIIHQFINRNLCLSNYKIY